jgi:hypothetical protein
MSRRWNTQARVTTSSATTTTTAMARTTGVITERLQPTDTTTVSTR